MRFYRKYKGLCKKYSETLNELYWRLSFWAQADLKSMKELFYHTNFKSLYKVRPNFLTLISFFAREMYFFFGFDHFSLHYSSHKQATLLFHCKELPKKLKESKKPKSKPNQKLKEKKKIILY